MQMPSKPQIEIGPDRPLTLGNASLIARGQACAVPSSLAAGAVARAYERLTDVITGNRHVYGITTGFGPLANRRVAAADAEILQQNLVHHLASGLAPHLDWDEARAVVLARFSSLSQGWSGVGPEAIATLLALLGSDLAPVLPSRGTVGASGDLTPLAHLVLCLQGRGDFRTRSGEILAGSEALGRLGVAPLSLARRDGLALVNGTSAMTGLAMLNAVDAARALGWSVRLGAALGEVLGGRAEAWAKEFGNARPHPGQIWASERLRACLGESQAIIRIPIASATRSDPATGIAETAGQDAYSLRCIPQIAGAVADALEWHDRVVTIELNSATDNPIFPPEGEIPALHGGNFMGCHVALASDALCTALLVLAGLIERQIARLTDERLNAGLPAFLHLGTPGLNSGFMGAQVTATAILAEMRSRFGPASVQSLSTNGANQDVVSLGTIAARGVRAALADLFNLLAILAMALAQARDIRDRPDGDWSSSFNQLHSAVRGWHPRIDTDRPLSAEIVDVAGYLARHDPFAEIS